MKSLRNYARSATAVALMVGSTFAAAASAPVLDVSGLLYNNWQYGRVTYNGTPSVNVNAYVGGYNTTYTTYSGSKATTTSFISWCVDIFQDIDLNTNYTDYTTGGSLNSVLSGNIIRLANEAYTSITDATSSAAFQIAIWELANETSSTFNVRTGIFEVTGGTVDPNALNLAQTWLNGLGNYSSTGYNLTLYQSATHQDVVSLSAVPEPDVYVMMTAGLGLMALIGRRRKRQN